MKKIYKVEIHRCDANEGKYTWTDTHYVRTDNIDAYIERMKQEIEAHEWWFMDHNKDNGRPWVTANEIEIKEV